MTTPKRYEEMARAWLTKKYGRIDSFSYQGGPTSADADDLEEVISTAARKAQVRVLEELIRLLPMGARSGSLAIAAQSLRARLDSGEDL